MVIFLVSCLKPYIVQYLYFTYCWVRAWNLFSRLKASVLQLTQFCSTILNSARKVNKVIEKAQAIPFHDLQNTTPTHLSSKEICANYNKLYAYLNWVLKISSQKKKNRAKSAESYIEFLLALSTNCYGTEISMFLRGRVLCRQSMKPE
jgi:hypothetical protein